MGVRAFEILDKKYSKNYGNLESALSYDDSAEKISRKKLKEILTNAKHKTDFNNSLRNKLHIYEHSHIVTMVTTL